MSYLPGICSERGVREAKACSYIQRSRSEGVPHVGELHRVAGTIDTSGVPAEPVTRCCSHRWGRLTLGSRVLN